MIIWVLYVNLRLICLIFRLQLNKSVWEEFMVDCVTPDSDYMGQRTESIKYIRKILQNNDIFR